MEIRQLGAEHFEERVALRQFAFQFTLTQEQIEELREGFRPEREWGVFEGGRLLAAMTLLPMEIWVHSRKMAMGGVASVATWPEARRKGCVAGLLRHGLETMRQAGQTVSMLHPFSFLFYRRYGWEMTIERKTYTLEPRHFPPRAEVPGRVERVAKDAGLLDDVYEAFASRYTGMLVRTPEWWERRVFTKPGIAAVYYNGDGKPEGYLLYEVKDRTMTVHEWVSVSEEARLGLWRYAADHDSMADRLTMTVPADDPLPFLLPDPRIKQELQPYFMSRIVDVEGFVAQYPFEPGEGEDAVTLAVEDEHAPWNRGVYRLRIDAAGRARAERMAEGWPAAAGDSADGAELACDIQTLTALLLGDRPASLLHETGRLRGDREAVRRLQRRIPRRTTYLADFF
ncbi:MAG TPA: GNAT family N-acetyltransferase [Paenibacillaceae bacterium]